MRGLESEGYVSAYVMAWPTDLTREDEAEFSDASRMAVRAMVEPDGSYRLEGLTPGPHYVSATAKATASASAIAKATSFVIANTNAIATAIATAMVTSLETRSLRRTHTPSYGWRLRPPHQ